MIGQRATRKTVERALCGAVMLAAVVLVASPAAHALPPPPPPILLPGPGGCGGTTLGSVICNTMESFEDFPGLMSAFCYLFGLVLGFFGILKVREHVSNPEHVSIWEPIKRFIAGGAFFALPIVIEAAYITITAGVDLSVDETGWAGITSGTGLDAMMANLVTDIWVPMGFAIAGFCYLAGIALIIIGISRLLKSAQDGPRGPGGFGTLMTFLVGGALLSFDSMAGAFEGSMFGSGNITTYANIGFAAAMTAPEIAHTQAVISAVLAFMMIVGWISFVRGWFIIRDVAEGNHGASLMAGMTHVFGGALAINLGPLLNAVQSTLGLTGLGINFT